MNKKLMIGLSLLVFCNLFANAQSAENDKSKYVSKKGTYIFPEQGEWAIGVYAPTVLLFQMNHAAQPVSIFTGPNQTAIWVKKMKSENKAIRSRAGFGIGEINANFTVPQSVLTFDPNNPTFVEDNVKTNFVNGTISLGIENRRGKSRFQGVYGYEGLIGFSSSTVKTKYGNPINADFTAPQTYLGNLASRPIEVFNGNTLFMGARGFVGVEYFFSAKASLGGEFGYTGGFSIIGRGYTINEYWNSETMDVQTITTPRNPAKLSSVGMGLDNFNAAINFFFYF